jgi:hypothetical protein
MSCYTVDDLLHQRSPHLGREHPKLEHTIYNIKGISSLHYELDENSLLSPFLTLDFNLFLTFAFLLIEDLEYLPADFDAKEAHSKIPKRAHYPLSVS